MQFETCGIYFSAKLEAVLIDLTFPFVEMRKLKISSIFLPDGMLHCPQFCNLLWIASNFVPSKVKTKNKNLPICMLIKTGKIRSISQPTSSCGST
jgi:hypothetical protein